MYRCRKWASGKSGERRMELWMGLRNLFSLAWHLGHDHKPSLYPIAQGRHTPNHSRFYTQSISGFSTSHPVRNLDLGNLLGKDLVVSWKASTTWHFFGRSYWKIPVCCFLLSWLLWKLSFLAVECAALLKSNICSSKWGTSHHVWRQVVTALCHNCVRIYSRWACRFWCCVLSAF